MVKIQGMNWRREHHLETFVNMSAFFVVERHLLTKSEDKAFQVKISYFQSENLPLQ